MAKQNPSAQEAPPPKQAPAPPRGPLPASRLREGHLQHHQEQIIAALRDDDPISAERACRQLLRELRPHVHADIAHARHNGATWAQIGQRLGITSQAARKRFKHRPQPPR